MILTKKWFEYITSEYGSLDECDDINMIEVIYNDCVNWFQFTNNIENDFDPFKETEVIQVWNNLIKSDKEFMTNVFFATKKWLQDRNYKQHLN